ncbi:hypothetical protein BDV26DRAFT_254146 [Aspergillus bertholletiae]|uniref:Uncharacterized protein n=1 Tax=Aspergillus bertholletiae TaxID=1226010 RepID=A0A5N7BL59_9EURO|nr:hypothetical protein BDV26DRAFT_254146 [Aspergillus bertholletiae]
MAFPWLVASLYSVYSGVCMIRVRTQGMHTYHDPEDVFITYLKGKKHRTPADYSIAVQNISNSRPRDRWPES